jgi:hypothetical protein
MSSMMELFTHLSFLFIFNFTSGRTLAKTHQAWDMLTMAITTTHTSSKCLNRMSHARHAAFASLIPYSVSGQSRIGHPCAYVPSASHTHFSRQQIISHS